MCSRQNLGKIGIYFQTSYEEMEFCANRAGKSAAALFSFRCNFLLHYLQRPPAVADEDKKDQQKGGKIGKRSLLQKRTAMAKKYQLSMRCCLMIDFAIFVKNMK